MFQLFACTSLMVSSLAAAAGPAKFDPPDLNFEYQLHRQYILSRGEVPRSPQGNLESYQLQNGETLWSLSRMLYGDGNYWPKVWAQNDHITNPHLVRPGHTLQFLLGSEDDAPAFRFSEAGDEAGLELASATTAGQPVQIPPPEIPPRPVIKVPPSFPAWQEVYHRPSTDFQLDDSKLVFERKMPPDIFPLSAFTIDKPLDAQGTFLETEKESGLPVEGQYVYVKLNKGKGMPGQKYLIVKDYGPLKIVNRNIEGPIRSRFVQVYGQVDITDKVESANTKNTNKDRYEIFRALLVKAMNLTLTDFELIPGEVEMVNMSKVGPSGTVDAQVIGSMKNVSSVLFGPGDLVFLNKGSAAGIQQGQVFDLAIDRSIRDVRTPVNFSGYRSGQVKVVKVSEKSATAVVLNSIDSIQQGDKVHSQARFSGGATPLEEKSPQSDGADSLDELQGVPGGDSNPPAESEPTSEDEMNLSE